MQSLKCSLVSRFCNLPLKPRSHFLFFSSFTSVPNPNSITIDQFIKSLNFSKSHAEYLMNRISRTTPEKPRSVIKFFQDLGFSDAQVRSSVRVAPQILFSDIDKILKPKINFFQELGLVDADLAEFIARNSSVLTVSLNKRLVPCAEVLKKVLLNDKNNEDLIRVVRRCSWILAKDPESVSRNVAYLESCGIVGTQLALLLRRQPRIFIMPESMLEDLVSRVVNVGFLVKSRMLVHAVYTVSCMSEKTLKRKLKMLSSYGFTEDERMEMFRRAPGLLRASEEKLKLGIEFFMGTVGFKKEVLVMRPTCLMNSLEDRVIPRFKVLQVLRSKGLLKKNHSFVEVVGLTEGDFVNRFISKFRDDTEELLVAYKGHLLDFSSSEEERLLT